MFDKEAIQQLQKAQAITAADEAVQVWATAALPSDFTVHDLERYMLVRRRSRGTMLTTSTAAFAEYIKSHRDDGATVFIDTANFGATAVLNLGTPREPGHADDLAVLQFKPTAAYAALREHANGRGHSQRTIAEFLEDWLDHVTAMSDEGEIPVRQAIAAVRSINIDAARQIGSEQQSLSATRSALETVRASSKHTLPDLIYFRCQPSDELSERLFVLRLGVTTDDDTPRISLRISREDAIHEEIGQELAGIIREAVAAADDALPVLLGKYEAKR